MLKAIELAVAAAVANSDVKLVNRRDSAVDGVSALDGKARKVTGIMGRSADAGYFLGMIDGEVVFSLDSVILNALVTVMPLDIDVPGGSKLSIYIHDTASTAVCTATVLYTE